jgi:uncharacterized protein
MLKSILLYILILFLFVTGIYLLYFFKARKIKSKLFLILPILSIFISLLTGYGTFVERFVLMVEEHNFQVGFQGRLGLMADTHIGQWKNAEWLRKVVTKLNTIENLDAVVVAGDLSYEPNLKEIDNLFSPFKESKYPVYAVLGNHDVEEPGPKIRDELIGSIKKANVKYLFNEGVKIKNYNIVGLGDNFKKEDDVKTLDSYLNEDNIIILAHNPDTILKYTNQKADFTLSGHTHCGQVRIPYIYKPFLPLKGDFDKGFYDYNGHKGFVNCGVGEVGFPIRLFNPPTIDIINFY